MVSSATKMYPLLVFCLVALNSSFVYSIAPKFGDVALKRSLNLGAKFRMTCNVDQGTGPFRFEWFKNIDRLNGQNQKNYEIKLEDDQTELTIFKVSQSDSANYSCKVFNDYGSDLKHTTLVVQGLLRVFSISFAVQYVAHKSLGALIFKCFCSSFVSVNDPVSTEN